MGWAASERLFGNQRQRLVYFYRITGCHDASQERFGKPFWIGGKGTQCHFQGLKFAVFDAAQKCISKESVAGNRGDQLCSDEVGVNVLCLPKTEYELKLHFNGGFFLRHFFPCGQDILTVSGFQKRFRHPNGCCSHAGITVQQTRFSQRPVACFEGVQSPKCVDAP